MPTKNLKRICLWMTLAPLLAGCATSYQSQSATGGYSESKISDSAYVVTFRGNGYASKDRVYYFWVYRCAELTLQQGYGVYTIRINQPKSGGNPAAGSAQPALYTDTENGQLVKTHSGGAIFVPGASGTATAWTYSATVLMYQKPLPDEVLWGVDAQQVVAALKPYIVSNGKTAPPSRDDLFKRAFLAHARVSVGDGASTAVDDPAGASAGSTAVSLPPRTADGVTELVEEKRLLILHALFRAYVLKSNSRNASGNLVMEFTVSPNGVVTKASVTASTFSDRSFNDAIAMAMRQLEFGPQNVASTKVSNFRIDFEPL
jgi:TonB family protein